MVEEFSQLSSRRVTQEGTAQPPVLSPVLLAVEEKAGSHTVPASLAPHKGHAGVAAGVQGWCAGYGLLV